MSEFLEPKLDINIKEKLDIEFNNDNLVELLNSLVELMEYQCTLVQKSLYEHNKKFESLKIELLELSANK